MAKNSKRAEGAAGRLAPGTACFLTSNGKPSELNGRVVEVVLGPREEHGDGPGPFYEVTAGWLRELFPGKILITTREHLIPITGPDVDVSSDERIDVDAAATVPGGGAR